MNRHSLLVLSFLVLGLVCVPLYVTADSVVDQLDLVGAGGDVVPDGYSGYADVSADGHWIAFYSEAGSLSPNDGAWGDVYVYDTQRQTTELVSVGHDASAADQSSGEEWAIRGLSISDDGNTVAFNSWASNLVPDDGEFGSLDVFFRDRADGLTHCVSVGLDGVDADGASWSPVVSGDGSHVAFVSRASNLVYDDDNQAADVFLADLATGLVNLVSIGNRGGSASPDGSGQSCMGGLDLSGDGRYVAFASASPDLVSDDTNDSADVFVCDMWTNQIECVSVSSTGRLGNGDSGENLPNGGGVALSRDGRYVAFVSWASNLVAGDTNQNPDVFVHDRDTDITVRVSVSSSNEQAQWPETVPAAYQQIPAVDISADGRYVTFQSAARNLDAVVSGDVAWSVYVHDLNSGETAHVADSYVSGGVAAQDGVSSIAISADASVVVFGSNSALLDPVGGPFSDVYSARLNLLALASGETGAMPTIVPTPSSGPVSVPTAPIVLPTVITTRDPRLATVFATRDTLLESVTPVPGATALPDPTPDGDSERAQEPWVARIWSSLSSWFGRSLAWLVSLSRG